MHPFRRAGLAAITFALVVNIPYVLLIDRFGYDDILRAPPLEVLVAFQAGGPTLVLIWLAFALCALGFVVVAGWVGEAIRATGRAWPGYVAGIGTAAALAQATGLLRWVFVVPGIAEVALDPTSDPAARQAALMAYRVVHQYAGVAIGEHLGQTLTAGWTLALSLAILRHRIAPRLFGLAGLVLATLWIIGQSELLATVIPIPVIEATPLAFMGWEAWLLGLGICWVTWPARSAAPASGWSPGAAPGR